MTLTVTNPFRQHQLKSMPEFSCDNVFAVLSTAFQPLSCRLVAVLDGRVHIHALETLAQLRIIETPPNPRGLAALTPSPDTCLLALPASNTSGLLRVYDLLVDGGHVVCEIQAHKTPLVALAWSHNGAYLATASTTGTVIRCG